MQTARLLLSGVAACAMLGLTLFGATSTALATNSNETAEKQVNVKVITTENGSSETVDKILTLDQNASIESILRQMGVIDEFGQIAEDEIVEIIVRRTKKDKVVQDLSVALEQEPAPGPPVERLPARVGTGFLGVNIGGVKPGGVNGEGEIVNGVQIRSIIPNTGAANSELRGGDVVVSIGGIPVSSVNQMIKTVQALKPGTTVEIQYLRNNEAKTTQAVLGTRAEQLKIERMRSMERWQERARELEKISSTRPFLGVSVQQTEAGESVIAKVHPNTAAAEMGIQAEDKVLSINGQELGTGKPLGSVLRSVTKVGEPVTITVERDGTVQTLNGTMKSRSANFKSNHFFSNSDSEKLQKYSLKMAELNMEEASESLRKLAGDLKNFYVAPAPHAADFPDHPPVPPVTYFTPKAPVAPVAPDAEVIREVRVRIALLDLEPAEADVLSRQTGEAPNGLQVQDLSLFPNPSDGRFQLKFDLPGDGLSAVKIFDVQGNEIYAETLNGVDGNYERMIDISDKSEGAYFLQVTRNGQSFTKKLIIN